MDLPQLTGADVQFSIGSNSYQGKVLNLLETAEVFSQVETIKDEKGEAYGNIMLSVLLVLKSLQKNYPEVTQEYVAELINNRDAQEVSAAINLIGGFDPKAGEAVSGSQPSELSAPTPDGTPEPSVS